jgi:hypothetical protein
VIGNAEFSETSIKHGIIAFHSYLKSVWPFYLHFWAKWGRKPIRFKIAKIKLAGSKEIKVATNKYYVSKSGNRILMLTMVNIESNIEYRQRNWFQ